MGGPPSPSSSSLSSSPDGRRRRRRRGGRRRDERDRDGGRGRGDGAAAATATATTTTALPPAPSDWDALRAHFRFVLPDDGGDDRDADAAAAAVDAAVGGGGGGDDGGGAAKYGATWQERMVKNYHAGLYKEFVLADLSRAFDLGRVGLRWRTEREVASGRGFRCCGNLACGRDAADSTRETAAAGEEDEAEYRAAARRHVGIGVAENGGRDPMGVVLPRDETDRALESYLKSCARERRRTERRERRRGSKRRRHRGGGSRSSDRRSLKRQERHEQKRLSRLPFGVGLHDYEADFSYVEQSVRKRELVKVRLCLRCAPLLFVAKANDRSGGGGREGSGGKGGRAPAVKAREAREVAARTHAAMSTGDDGDAAAASNANANPEGAEKVRADRHSGGYDEDRRGRRPSAKKRRSDRSLSSSSFSSSSSSSAGGGGSV